MKTTKDDQFTSQSRTLPFIDRFMFCFVFFIQLCWFTQLWQIRHIKRAFRSETFLLDFQKNLTDLKTNFVKFELSQPSVFEI